MPLTFQNLISIRPRRIFYLMFGLLVAGTVLVALHALTIQITASSRAYIAGESQYSKAQKDAARHLMLYTLDGDPKYYAQFRQELEVYRGDSIARETLLNDGDMSIVRHGFRAGNNHPEDIDDLVWLLDHFHWLEFIQRPVEIWRAGDRLVAQLASVGEEVRNARKTDDLAPEMQMQFMQRIEFLTQEITEKEREFSEQVGLIARTSSSVLFIANALFIAIIAIGSALLVALALNSLEKSRTTLRERNKKLAAANKKLDSFLYAASHDLKSPINNIQGLIGILMAERSEANDTHRDLLQKVKTAAQNLKASVIDIENLLRTDQMDSAKIETLEFENILEQILEENEMSFLVSGGEISWQFEIPTIRYSAVALKSVLFNLVSNAVKYQSPERTLELSVRTYADDGQTVLEVADNGVGIDLEKHGEELFGMFKRFHHFETGTGLGLYAVKGIVENFEGEITVESTVNEGTTFRIYFGHT